MIPFPSTRFANALTASFNLAVKLEVHTAPPDSTLLFSSVVPQVPTSALDLYILDGSVTYDRQQDVRSQCSMKLVSPNGTFIPNNNSSPFTCWGNELHIYWGITYDDGTQEFILMGKFRIARVAIEESQGAPIMSLTGYDRSRNISRNVVMDFWPHVQQQYQIFNKSFANLIQLMCADRWAPVQFSGTTDDGSAGDWNQLQSDPWSLPTLTGAGFVFGQQTPSFSQGTDLWSQSRQYAQSVGCDLFFSRDGICTFVRDPNFITQSSAFVPDPVATFVEGSTAMFDKISRTLDDQAAYNACLVFGETPTLLGPVISNFPVGSGPDLVGGLPKPVTDNDPDSPTYYSGPYGKVPHIITSNLLATQAQVDNYAVLMLIVDLGAQESVAVPSSAINPCIEVNDVVTIQRTRIGVPQGGVFYIVNSLTVPLTTKSQMQMSVRQKRNLEI